MNATVTTTIPAFNGQAFLLDTLESLAKQTRRPDRVLVLDDGSTDRTAEIVRGFGALKAEFIPNSVNPGLFENFNRCLDRAAETDYLHILHQDDMILPEFYERMTRELENCQGRGMAWCLDERIDEAGKPLSVSGKADGRVKHFGMDEFLARKAEISNQAFCATLLKTNRQPIPERFPTDMPILGDMVFWAKYGAHCRQLSEVNLPLARYRWHGSNQTVFRAPSVNALIVDEWRTMQIVEALRGKSPGLVRRMKLNGLLAVRSGIKAKRFRQLGNLPHAQKITEVARGYTGWPLWLAGQFLVELRELIVFRIGGRPRHPQNVFS
jgi:glycosyltransferase involved in cell wall biosynthesis